MTEKSQFSLLNTGKATLTLHELERMFASLDYGDFVAEVRSFIDEGLLRPMGKDTNGMSPPLHTRYRICREKEDVSSIQSEIMRLGPEFYPSAYLTNLSLYHKHRELLLGLRNYVRDHGSELECPMSKNERSYAIWGNEKLLDSSLVQGMLRFTKWGNRLNYFSTPEPYFDYLVTGADTSSILVLENKDIWFSLRKLFMENPGVQRLYGQNFDGLLYGEGNKITRHNALKEYVEEGFSSPPSLFYWGDLDYEGIAIFLKASASFPMTLFVPGYMEMLKHSRERQLTTCRTVQTQPSDMERFLSCFDAETAFEIFKLLDAKLYIPQEICNYPRLKAALHTYERIS